MDPFPPVGPSAWTPLQTGFAALLVFAGCSLGAACGTRFVFPEVGTAVLFPSYAVLTAALLVAPWRGWAVLVVAAAAGNLWPHFTLERSVPFVLEAETANIVRALVAGGGVRLVCGRPRLDSLRDVAVTLAFGALLAPAVAATIGATAAVWHDGAPFGVTWQAWMLSNTLTGVTLLPLLLQLATLRPAFEPIGGRVEAAVLIAGISVVGSYGLVASSVGALGPVVLLAPLPFLLWAAMRYGPPGAVAALSAITVPTLYGAFHGSGPFVAGSPAENLLQLQLFLVLTHAPALLLAAQVAEHRAAAVALRESQARYRSVVEDQTELICRFLPDGTCTFVNGACARAAGLRAEELIGAPRSALLPRDTPEREAESRELRRSMTPEHPVVARHRRLVSPNGDVRFYEWTERALFDPAGRVLEYQAVGRDVTELRQAEEQRWIADTLRASERRFRQLADNAPVLIWQSGLQNEGVYFNKPWLDFTGRTLEQELGYGWLESVHPDDRVRCAAICDEAFAQRAPLVMQFRMRRHDGAWRWLLDNGVAYFEADGAFNGYLGSCVDITERHVEQERLEEADRRKDEFLAMLGHELRNPLAPIGMAVQLMRKRPAHEDTIVWAREAIARQLAQLTRIVDDLLDLSRITRGTIRLARQLVGLERALAQAVETSQPMVRERSHTLGVDVPGESLPVDGDAARLTQIFSNLLSNAARYTDPGGRIALCARRDDATVVVTVSDNGAGIPADMLERVFDMFTQVGDPGARAQGGLGIGLTLVRRLVEMHGGTVEAHSEGPGRGSEFVVRLPLAMEVGTDPPLLQSFPTPLPGERRRVLVVDDNVDAAESLLRVLRLDGHEVLVAHDGRDALAVATRARPEVILLDVGMPEMDGLEVARRLRDQDAWRPLLVATSGFGRAEDRRRTAEAGFDHHLVKPLDLAVLRSVLSIGPHPQ